MFRSRVAWNKGEYLVKDIFCTNLFFNISVKDIDNKISEMLSTDDLITHNILIYDYCKKSCLKTHISFYN